MKRKTTEIKYSRTSPIPRPGLMALLSVLLIQTLASPTAESSPDYPPSPGPTVRIAVAYSGKLPQFDLQIPDTKSEVAEEMAVKLGLSWVRDFREGDIHNEYEAMAVMMKMALTPVGMAAGAVYGPLAGESARKMEPALKTLTKAMTELQVQEGPRGQLPGLICHGSRQPIIHLTNSFPAETAFRVPSLMDTIVPPLFARRPTTEGCLPPDMPKLDTLLLIRVVNHGLSGPDGHNSPLSLNLAVCVTVVRMTDRTQLFGFYAQYDSTPRRFVDWAVNDAQPFREECQRALQSVAGQIIAQAGLLVLPNAPAPISIVQASKD